jgi:uncharacterized delta-60 repeat protein
MVRHWVKPGIAIVVVVLMVTAVLIPSLSAQAFSYHFEPGSSYTQSSGKVVLKMSGFSSSDPTPVRVDWIDPYGNQVYCNGGQGACWDQNLGDNGVLIWRAFYLPIAGAGRPNGTYTAHVYSNSSQLFTANFTISGSTGPTNTPVTPTNTPTPFPTPVPIGRLDPSFGSNGCVTAGIYPLAITLQGDGEVVVAGTVDGGGKNNADFGLLRYKSDGSLDTTFGVGGKVTTDFFGFDVNGGYDQANAVAMDGNKIIAAGQTDADGTADVVYFALARYNSDGSPDAGFGGTGKLTTDFYMGNTGSNADMANAIAVQDDGKIVVAGEHQDSTGHFFALARYNSDGSLDTGFGSKGKVTTSFGDNAGARAVMLQGDKIVAAGGYAATSHFDLARYNADGSLDASFGSGGKVVTTIGVTGGDGAYALALQDGKIIAVGESHSAAHYATFALARYNSDGSLDASFGSGGIVTTSFEAMAIGRAVLVQDDGKIVVTGETFPPLVTNIGNETVFALARYNANGNLDSIVSSGKLITDDCGSSGFYNNGAAIQGDGKIIAISGSGGNKNLARFILKSASQFYLPLVNK